MKNGVKNFLTKGDCGYGLNEKNDIIERHFNFLNIRHTRVIIVLDLTIVDGFEQGDRLEIHLDEVLVRTINYDERVLHHIQNCGSSDYRDRIHREILNYTHSSSNLKLTINLIKGE